MYKIVDGGVIRLTDKAFIPANVNNGDYQKFLKWLSEGNKPIPKDVPFECINEDFSFDENCVFLNKKNEKLKNLGFETQHYIFSNYSDLKQKSDIVDKVYFENIVKLQLDELTFRQLLSQAVVNIYDNNSTLETELNNIYTSLHIASDNLSLRKAIEQLLKVAIRTEFVQRVKFEYNSIKRQIENATNLDALKNIEIKFTTEMPL